MERGKDENSEFDRNQPSLTALNWYFRPFSQDIIVSLSLWDTDEVISRPFQVEITNTHFICSMEVICNTSTAIILLNYRVGYRISMG